MPWTLEEQRPRRTVQVPRRSGPPEDYVVLEADGVEVTLSMLSMSELRAAREAVRERLTRHEPARREVLEAVTAASRGRERLPVGVEHYLEAVPPDEEALTLAWMEEVYTRALVGWRGVERADGSPVPCTPETRQLAARDAWGLVRWVWGIVVGAASRSETAEAEEAATDAGFRRRDH